MTTETETETASEPPVKPVEYTDADLRQLAVDMTEGKVFGTWQFSEHEIGHMAASVFMPLMFLNFKELPEDTVHFYEYLSAAVEMSINGYPTFMSMRYLRQKHVEPLAAMVKELVELREKFLNPNGAPAESTPAGS